MSYYYKLGRIPHKRHTQFRQPDGSLYHEELMGIRGFVGDKSLLYHLRPPTDVREIDRGCEVKIPYAEPGPVQHRLLRTADVPSSGDAVTGRIPLMANSDVCISVARPQQPMPYWYRYAHGDEAIFVHEGTGLFESQFGTLHYKPGDYLVIPTGVMWRIVPDAAVDQRMLVIESAGGHIEPPRRYVNQYGQFLESAPYAERDIRPPDALETHDEEGEFEVRVKARGFIARYLYRSSSARRRRLGRTPVAVCVQHRRLRADYRTRAPAAAGPSDVRRARLRDLFVRAALVRLPPALDPGALQPLERRLGRSHLLREGGLHVAPGHCLGGAHRAPQRHPARAASRDLRGLDRQGTDR